MSEILFSIIMPTYNSESTIEKALQSIRMQDLPEESIEILVIDGGSTDRTLDIATLYGAVILENPKKFPEYAKRIGFAEAKGRWIVMQDSDEVLTDKAQFRKRKNFFEQNPEVHCLILDKYIPGEHCGIACAYTNWFGDPFSYVVYRLADSRIRSNKKYLFQSTEFGNIYFYEENDIIPIGDGGTTTIDIKYAKEIFGDFFYTQEFAVSIFYNMVKKTGYVACIMEDNIIHYSMAPLGAYFRKLHFRVYTNINSKEQSGYSTRAKNNRVLNKRKRIFVLYVLSIILPFLDAIRMCVSYKKPSLLLHFVYTYYVAIVLAVEIVKKILHIQGGNYRYGK